MKEKNPFFHGTPVPPEKLIGRNNELSTIAGRIDTGQSTAITGSPRCGKTSILQYLETETKLYDNEEPEKQIELYNEADKLIFSYLDAYTWGTEFKSINFWENALKPLLYNETLAEHYQECQKYHFDNFLLEKLIKQLNEVKQKLILMIDNFDMVLNYSAVDWNAQFFGGLRTLASRSNGGFIIVITMNQPLSHFQTEVQEFTKTQSPYFNFIYEIMLGGLSEQAIEQLLNQGKDHFTEEDYTFLKDIAGGHPYLLQVAASVLWDFYLEGGKNSQEYYPQIQEKYYLEVKQILREMWQSWYLSLQQVFVSVALAQMKNFKYIFEKQRISVDSISQGIPPLKLEAEFLKQYGFFIEDEKIQGGWRIVPRIFLPFILLNFKAKHRNKLPQKVWDNLFALESSEGLRKKRFFFKLPWQVN
jgi:hypothetical protein